MFTICDDARKILDSMLWRMADNWTPAERERTVKALLLMADYVQDTKNPKEMATDAWVVEVFVMRILEQFHSYEAYEAKNYNNPLSLAGFASFFRCPPLLQRTEGPRQAPPKGHSSAGQQVGRDPARVPRKWHSLRREHRVVTPPGTRRLTFTTKGCLRLEAQSMEGQHRRRVT